MMRGFVWPCTLEDFTISYQEGAPLKRSEEVVDMIREAGLEDESRKETYQSNRQTLILNIYS